MAAVRLAVSTNTQFVFTSAIRVKFNAKSLT